MVPSATFLLLLSIFARITECGLRLRGLRDDTSIETGQYSLLFTTDEYSQLQQKRIRREIRDISQEQWDAIAAAMNIMKTVNTSYGRTLYGDAYLSYDDLVCQHARGSFHTGGDLGHIGPHFNIWHRAFVLSFENILISIDDTIESVPYWDFRRDIIGQNSSYDLTNSIIFSDDYFGDYSTANDVNGDRAVKNGKFAYWRIHDNPAELSFECTDFYQNAFGLLRQRDNIEGNPFVTRFGGKVCGDDFAVGDLDVYDECLETVADYTQFFGCYNFNVHARAHIGVGGTTLAFANQTVEEHPLCTFWHASSWTKSVNNIRKWAQLYECFDCPAPGSCVYEEDDPFECAMCSLNVNMTDEGQVCDIEGFALTIRGNRESQQIFGDFLDQSTSPNDPIFMFHHVNMDRYLTEWQIRNYEQAPYYNYPTTGYQTGINLDDVIAPEAPFTKLFDGENQESIGDGPYTIRDIWDGTAILNAVYVYDTVLEMVEPVWMSTTELPDDARFYSVLGAAFLLQLFVSLCFVF